MALNSLEIERTIMDVACVAQSQVGSARCAAEDKDEPEQSMAVEGSNAKEVARAKQAVSNWLKLLGSISDFERDVLAEIVDSAGEFAKQGMSEWAIRRYVRRELYGLIETVQSMAIENAHVDVETRGELESLDHEAAMAWVEVSPGLRVKCEMPAKLFEGANLKPGQLFVIDAGGKKARFAGEKRLISAENVDTVAESLVQREATYREKTKSRKWRVAEDED
jgi:hypothetical protein